MALSGVAIVLGVAFVAGSFIMTDTMRSTFDGIIKGTTADVQVSPAGAGTWASGADSRTIPASVVNRLRSVPGAAAVHGVTEVQGVWVIGTDGKVVGGSGAPGLAFNPTDTRAITGNRIITLIAGRQPSGIHQIALDSGTAEKAGYRIGDLVTLNTPGPQPTMKARLTGLVSFGSHGGLAGATLTIFDQRALQQLFFDGRDVFTSVSMTAAPGVSQAALAAAAQRALPHGLVARQGDAVAAQNEKLVGSALSFVNTFLLVFAAIALIVGSFLIVNTFSILVAQRSRELALLRAMGASRRQVNRSVLAEALAVGLVGSTAGIGVGYLLAIGLKALFGTFGLDLSGATMPLHLRTVAISYAVGLVVTAAAAYLPARRAGRVAPVEAMRDDVSLGESSLRRRVVVGGVLMALGLAAGAVGLLGSGNGALLSLGLGALAILVGLSLLSPVLGRPLVAGAGWVYRRAFGAAGRLAEANAARNPRRTAATASALMVGLTLVATMAILGQSAKASTEQSIRQTMLAPLVVSNATQQPFSPAVAKRIRGLAGVQTAAELRQAPGTVDGRHAMVDAVNPRQVASTLNVQVPARGVAALARHAILVDASEATSRGYHLGQTLTLRLQGTAQRLVVAGTFPTGSLPTKYLVSLGTFARGHLQPLDQYVFVTTRPDADLSAVAAEIDRVLSALPTVTLQTQDEFVAQQSQQIDQFLALVYALLGLAIVIAVLGIVNTLALSVIERTRELGLLRAVGLSRRQLRRMVRLEAVVVALLGAVLGVALGVGFGIATVLSLGDQGVGVLSVPVVALVAFVVASGVVGVLAAVVPARRAARLEILPAIATE